MTEDPLDELIGKAEETTEKFSKVQKQARKTKDQLRDRVKELHQEGEMSEAARDDALGHIDNANYGKVRNIIQEETLTFEDEDLQTFADRFSESYEEMTEMVEQVRNTVQKLEDGISQDDMVNFLFGKHGSLRKTDIENVFDAIDTIERTGVSDKKLARILAAVNSDLNITDAEKVIEKIRQEAKN